jgi:hypothetical protein
MERSTMSAEPSRFVFACLCIGSAAQALLVALEWSVGAGIRHTWDSFGLTPPWIFRWSFLGAVIFGWLAFAAFVVLSRSSAVRYTGAVASVTVAVAGLLLYLNLFRFHFFDEAFPLAGALLLGPAAGRRLSPAVC